MPSRKQCNWFFHWHLCQFSAAESIPTDRSHRGGVAAEEERNSRRRWGGGFDSLYTTFAFDLAG